MEEWDFALSAITTLFQFAKYGRDVVPIENGRKLRLYLGNNRITFYRSGETLLLGHKGTANPLAERCADVRFTLSGDLLEVTLTFGGRTYVFQVVPGYLLR